MQDLNGKRVVITGGSQGPGARDGRGAPRCLRRERDRNWPRIVGSAVLGETRWG
jgi:hypothetical protein